MTRHTRWVFAILCSAGFGLPELAHATSQVVRVDGSVFDSTGAPITANKDILIKAYDAATAGTLLWTSSVYNTTVTSGKFTINLDASSGSPSLVDRLGELSSSQAIYFQIEVDSDTANGAMNTATVVLPRVRAKGTSFALSAASADALKGVTATTAEMNYLAGTTAALQTQINGTASSVSGKVSKSGDSMSGALNIGADLSAQNLNATNANGKIRIGSDTVLSLGTGASSNNTLLGVSAGSGITTGVQNTFVGYLAGHSMADQSYSSFFGYDAGSTATGGWNNFFGYSAGRKTTGDSNLMMGNAAGINNVGGSDNVFLGHNAGSKHVSGNYNVAIGYGSGPATSATDANNVLVGAYAGNTISSGSNNTLVGYDTDAGATVGSSIALGASAVVTANSAVQIGVGTNSTANSLQFHNYNFLTDSGNATFAQVGNATATEINYLSGVTAAIQTQINNLSSAGSYLPLAGGTVTGNLQVNGEILSPQLPATQNVGLTAVTGATNTLVINLVGEDGSTPSATNPVGIKFRSATVTSGTQSTLWVTSALSITIPSGTTIGTVANDAQYLSVYAINNAGTVELALSLDGFKPENKLISTTALSGGTSPTTLYSTTARTNVPVRYLGKFLAPQSTAGTWAANPTEVSVTARPSYPVTDWFDAGVITITGATTNPTKGTTTSDNVKWRRVGDSMELSYGYVQSTAGAAGSGNYYLGIPGGYTIDTAKTNAGEVGAGQCFISVGTGGTGVVGIVSSTNLYFNCVALGGSTGYNTAGSGWFSMANTGLYFEFFARVPISGWSTGN